MGIVYYGLNFKKICVEQSNFKFYFQFDYDNETQEKPDIHLDDFVISLNGEEFDNGIINVIYGRSHADICIDIRSDAIPNTSLIAWNISGELGAIYQDKKKNRVLFIDMEGEVRR